ncbi:T9SS type A sorting domain-containing protein [Wenyingzhuangia sp. chi5]|uniref:T9SS type A sorting domain-containing protein n=1 Tax=Wenyingzhuangia gilva TaxID=3057677 RepID=A0ABT8VPV5_9FLAO|nr:T9SS type A sorting domain-containing protein [Wenyingzhuangia sp. chi5]MDO3694004.1 T9SS type A sorting domain-containing protein [Wenyingzhuangia sp. chi5]
MLLFAVMNVSAQNLIPNWDANGATGAGSEGNMWGFASNAINPTWGEANGGGVRYRDNTTFPIEGSSESYTGRHFLYRWDGGYEGSIMSLGVTSSTGQGAISLEAGKVYELTGYYLWLNNGIAPTYQFSFSDTPTGTALSPQEFSQTETEIYKEFTYSFTPPTTGDYYLQLTQTNGLTSSTGGIIQLANLNLENTGTLSSKNISNIKPEISFNNDVLSVTTNSAISSITLFDILGRSVLSNNNSSTISISSLQSGTYILRVTTTSGEVQVVKFAK